MLKCPARFSHGRDGGAVKRKVARRDLVRDENLVSGGPPCPASSVGSWVGRPYTLLRMAERNYVDTRGRSRHENLSELLELCKDSPGTLRANQPMKGSRVTLDVCRPLGGA